MPLRVDAGHTNPDPDSHDNSNPDADPYTHRCCSDKHPDPYPNPYSHRWPADKYPDGDFTGTYEHADEHTDLDAGDRYTVGNSDGYTRTGLHGTGLRCFHAVQ